MKTYDIHFNDPLCSNSKGMELTKSEAIDYIETWNGTDNSYFLDYVGGTVSVVCNETEETVYEVECFAGVNS